MGALALGALGVVYGDIGISPLYAMREAFHGPSAIPITASNIYGVLSLVFWSLIIVISSVGAIKQSNQAGRSVILADMAQGSGRVSVHVSCATHRAAAAWAMFGG